MLTPQSSSGVVGYADRAAIWCREEPNSSAFPHLYFDRQIGQRIAVYSKVSRQPLGTTHPPTQWVLTALKMRKQRPGCGNDQLPSPSVEVETGWTYPFILQSAFKTRVGTNSLPTHFGPNVICNTYVCPV